MVWNDFDSVLMRKSIRVFKVMCLEICSIDSEMKFRMSRLSRMLELWKKEDILRSRDWTTAAGFE